MSITKTPVINAQLDRIGEATELLALAHAGTIEVMSEKGIQQIVRSGLASKFFSYGDQVSEKWAQDDTHEYDYDQDVVAFLDAVNALHKAAEDPGIKYLYIKTDNPATGLTKLEELRKAITDFRKSGKAVISYGEAFTSGSYYIASVSDKIYTTAHIIFTSCFITVINLN